MKGRIGRHRTSWGEMGERSSFTDLVMEGLTLGITLTCLFPAPFESSYINLTALSDYLDINSASLLPGLRLHISPGGAGEGELVSTGILVQKTNSQNVTAILYMIW